MNDALMNNTHNVENLTKWSQQATVPPAVIFGSLSNQDNLDASNFEQVLYGIFNNKDIGKVIDTLIEKK